MIQLGTNGPTRRVRRALKPVVSACLYYGGYHRIQLERHARSRAVILMYHRVRRDSSPATNATSHAGFDAGVSVRHFERQMRFIRERLAPIGLGELVDRVREGTELPPRAVAVTFDDGYRDTFDLAYPVLRRHGISATVFVATAFIDSPGLLWWDATAEMIRRTSVASLDLWSAAALAQRGSGSPGGPLPLKTPKDRIRATEILVERVRVLPPARVAEALATLQAALHVDDSWRAETHLTLSWEQIREMARNGIRIESHTHTHPNLALLDPGQVEDELRRSRTLIEEHTGRLVRGLAYPWGIAGTYSEETARIAARCGYHYACAVGIGSVGVETDPFTLARLPVGDVPAASMGLDIVQAYRRA